MLHSNSKERKTKQVSLDGFVRLPVERTAELSLNGLFSEMLVVSLVLFIYCAVIGLYILMLCIHCVCRWCMFPSVVLLPVTCYRLVHLSVFVALSEVV